MKFYFFYRLRLGKPLALSHRISRLPFFTLILAYFPVKWFLTPRGKLAVRVPFSSG